MLFGSFVAMVTPLLSSDVDKAPRVDCKSLENLLKRQIQAKTKGVVMVGSTGEGMLLSKQAFEEALEVAQSVCQGRMSLIAGVGGVSLDHVLSLIHSVQKYALDALMVVTPLYSKPCQEGLYQYYETVHGATDFEIIVYDNPSRTGVALAKETLLKLSKLPRIKAFKDASGDPTRPAYLRGSSWPQDVSLLGGEDSFMAGFLAQGGHGMISVTGNILPKACHVLATSYEMGVLTKETQKAWQDIFRLQNLLFRHPSPSVVKGVLARLGLCQETLCAPLVPAPEELVHEALTWATSSSFFE